MKHAAGTINAAVREEWLERQLALIKPGSRILDAGAGERQFQRLCTHLEYVSQDFAQYDGTGDGSGLQTGSWDQSGLDIVSDITDIPQPDTSFDAIMCVEVFEHLPDPLSAIREFRRLLRDGGTLIITAPFASLTHYSPHFYYSGFSRYFYLRNLEAEGFDVLRIESNGNFFEFVAQEVRRIPQMAARTSPDSWNRLRRKLYQLSSRIMLSVLSDLSADDTGSSELLCFGLHVVARKRSPT